MSKSITRIKCKSIALLMTGVMIGIGLTPFHVSAAETSNGKEEVVYVNADANGKVTEAYVVNIFTEEKITDYGDYSTVKNMNTKDEIFYQNGVIQIQNSASKLYYEGILETVEIPWDIDITYKIDEKTYSAEEIAGKSGKLTIEMSMKENTKAKAGFFNNYALQAVVKLDTTNCKNILSDGATMANVGNVKQLTYTVMPGYKKDILITSDVTDFEMESIAFNGIRLNLGIEEDAIDTGELNDKISELQNSVVDLDNGAGDLNSGAGELKDGAQKLNDGINTISSALNTLSSKSPELTEGSEEVQSALLQIQSALSNVTVSTEELTKLSTASTQIKTGIDGLTEGIKTVDSSIGSYNTSLSAAGLSDVSTFVESHNQAISSLGITGTQRTLYSAYEESGESGVQTKLGELVAGGDADATELFMKYSGGDANSITDYITEAGKKILLESLLQADISYIQGSQQLIGGIDASLDSNTGELMTGALALQTNYNTFHESILGMVSSLEELAGNMSTLKKGINTLVANYDTLDTGIREYADAVNNITSGYSQVTEGALQMVDGTYELYNGTTDLTEGTGEFVNETTGMQEEVDEKIDSMLEEFSGTDYDVVSFVSDKNTNVKSVQFVIKTSAIEKAEIQMEEVTSVEKMNLWEKFLNLFGL